MLKMTSKSSADSAANAESALSPLVLDRDELPRDGSTYEFPGRVSRIRRFRSFGSGGGVRLHQHPYMEIFIIQEGTATFIVGPSRIQAPAGQIIVVPALTPHRFTAAGARPLRQIDIHVNGQLITDPIEE